MNTLEIARIGKVILPNQLLWVRANRLPMSRNTFVNPKDSSKVLHKCHNTQMDQLHLIRYWEIYQRVVDKWAWDP